MATYTSTLYELTKWYYPTLSIKDGIEAFRKRIFDFEYPVYGLTSEEISANKKGLETQIIKHYFMREIGFETEQLWQFKLDERLNLIMPRYVELYKTTLFELDLDNPYMLTTTHDQTENELKTDNEEGTRQQKNVVDISDSGLANVDSSGKQTETGKETRNENSTNRTNADRNELRSDFPNSSFNNGDYATDQTQVEEGSSSIINTDDETERNNTITNTGDTNSSYNSSRDETANMDDKYTNDRSISANDNMEYLHVVKGRTSNAEILDSLAKWRALIVNINELIIKELADLFMLVYN